MAMRNFIANFILSYVLAMNAAFKGTHQKYWCPFLWAGITQQQPWSIFFPCFDMLLQFYVHFRLNLLITKMASLADTTIYQLSHLKYAFYINRACILYGCWQIFRSMFIQANLIAQNLNHTPIKILLTILDFTGNLWNTFNNWYPFILKSYIYCC